MHARHAALVVVVLAVSASAHGAGAGSAGLITFWNDDPIPSIYAVRPDGTGLTPLLRTSQNAKRARASPPTADGWRSTVRRPASRR